MNVSREEALRIAREDAERVYSDLSIYTVSAAAEGDSWRVEFRLADPTTIGGGASYVISAETAEIVSKHYEQ